jgi:phage terminase Nu1 subunit (DNA packaging protein)
MEATDSGVTRPKRGGAPKASGVTRGRVTPELVGKAALCEALGWTRPRLDRRLESDAAFPVAKRGTRAGGWEFDVAAITAYLSGAPAKAAPAAGKKPAARIDARSEVGNPYPGAKFSVVPPAGVEPVIHSGEQTARQRRDAVQAEILEDKLRRDRGELVQVEVMRQMLNTMLAHLGKGIDRLPDQIIERLNLPEERSDDIRVLTDELRRAMADELRVLLG